MRREWARRGGGGEENFCDCFFFLHPRDFKLCVENKSQQAVNKKRKISNFYLVNGVMLQRDA